MITSALPKSRVLPFRVFVEVRDITEPCNGWLCLSGQAAIGRWMA
jgi:hypothetical protein